jgi:hypothetical protein
MIELKRVFDAVESDDKPQLWVDLIGSTKDCDEWCRVTRVLPPQLGPPRGVWRWFAAHPDGYEDVRNLYLRIKSEVGKSDGLLQELIARLM